MSRTIDGQGARTRLASKPIDAGPVRTGRPDDTGAAAAARRAGRDLPRFARSRGGFSAIASRVLTALPAALVVLVAVVGPSLIPLVTSGSATSPVGGSFAPPSPGLPLGTDMLGRDALARVLAGGQALIAQAVSATLLGSAVGLVTGVWAGSTHRRRTEAVVLRIIDAIAAIPALLLLLLLAAGSPGDDAVVAIAIAAVSVPFSVRVVRERTRMLASSDAALEAVARGDGRWMRVRDDLLPGLIRVALAEAGIRFVAAAQLAATAGFLGLGGGAPAAGWGRMVRENTAGLALNPLPVLVPALLLMLLAIGVTALLDRVVERGDARVLAPRMRVPGRDRGRAGVRPRGGGGDAAEPSAARVVDGASVSSLTVADTSGVLVLDGLDLDLPAGEVTGLVGESGAGKTTLALALLGHLGGGLRLAGGSVRVNGHDPFTTTGRRAVRGRAAAYLPQDPSSALDPSRTVVAQLRTAARIAHPRASPGRRAALVNRAVHDAAFEPDLLGRRPLHLSGGQAQRALLAWAYVARPRLLILDEPTSGLDPETAGRVSARFAALPWRPAVLLISHDRELVDRICTTTVIIGEGRAS
ncbi:MAG: ATP-binding cassette domain-containing protein, partial [Pseudoclavibacter sp.]